MSSEKENASGNANAASAAAPFELRLTRVEFGGSYTIGKLDADGSFFCWTIEDQVRADPNPDTPQNEAKVPGKTAIPAGRYRLMITRSPRFRRELPELLKVPGFVGVRIHSGNTADDTEGCIIVGFRRGMGGVFESRPAMQKLQLMIEKAILDGREAWISISEQR
jgi:hypothetical protein